jgi:CPA2 family monovalent cation:H+ antiporter-2
MQEYSLLINLAVALSVAALGGLLAHRLGLSPILGYLLAGVVIGPQTPGFVADVAIARQLAEIGVVLLMFGVGLQFDLKDLAAVKNVAIPGVIGEIIVGVALGVLIALSFGWPPEAGLVLGIAGSVASTVVLTRALGEQEMLETVHGHIAVGWSVLDDIFTVFVLVILPALAISISDAPSQGGAIFTSLAWAILKLVVLGGLLVFLGRRTIPWMLSHVARERSRELFTLAVLAVALTIAAGAALFFGVSIALGAFLAGLAVAQSEVSHQAAAEALPMRDAFAVLFFTSVGMLFDPKTFLHSPGFILAILGIILVAKPLTVLAITWAQGYSVRTALTVVVSLSQIGEFSFILADLAAALRLLPFEGQSLIVSCALVSIALNPLLFRVIGPVEAWLHTRERLWRTVSHRSEDRGRSLTRATQALLAERPDAVHAIVVGYGPVGQTVSRILKDFDMQPVIIDMNVDTIRSLSGLGEPAIYGDASRPDILKAAGIDKARYLLLTLPDRTARTRTILTARRLNSDLRIFVRARYLIERAWLKELGATEVCYEEAEAATGLAALLLQEVGASEEQITAEINRIRAELALRTPEVRLT